MNLVAFIPARGGSKSIPLKNIKLLAGKPLIFWAIEAALKTSCINHVYVSTDCKKIKSCVEKINNKKVSIISRSLKTATDTASSESALLEFCDNYQFEHVFFIQATSPLLTENDLSNAWKKYQKNDFDSLLSVVKQKRFIWEESSGIGKPKNYEPANRPRRQEFDGFFVENGAFYLSSRQTIISSKCRISGRVGLYEMSEETYFEIDEPADWTVVENLLKKKSRYV
ncbi:acylneuraminate cytidylyltransferase family protein [Candidatus Dependentiae bacterium]|nr:acylneuraminate cytidylyltransferase family protein [Candidatus Dependentiae bacterium]